MAVALPLSLTNWSAAWLLLLAPVVSILLTRLYTSLRFYLGEYRASDGKPSQPLFIPYSIPWLGHAREFLAPTPGKFWRDLLTKYISRSKGACTLLLGGRKTHLMFSSAAVQALFKSRLTSRHVFNIQVLKDGFAQPEADIELFYGNEKRAEENEKAREQGLPLPHSNVSKWTPEYLNDQFVLKQESANELTARFLDVFREQLKGESETWKEVNLYAWLRHHMFIASTVALMGERLFEVYPTITEDFWIFDQYFLSMFFGLPKFFAPDGWDARDRLIKGFTDWVRAGQKEYQAAGLSPDCEDGRDWEPIFGAKITRGRVALFEEYQMSDAGEASQHLGFLFGLSSNAIPTAGWMLMHCLDPNADSTFYPRLLAEARSAQKADGSLDVNALIGMPLLQSAFHESMRLYVDVLVTRQVLDDIILPIDDQGHQILVKKNDTIMAPSWLGHRDETVWSGHPVDEFYPDRFIKKDPKTGKDQFTMVGTNGKLFPFGGGRNICPGRVFAKQEVLASVALVLSGFDIEVIGFVDKDQNMKKTFPGIKNTFVGNGAVPMDGDIKVRLRKRTSV